MQIFKVVAIFGIVCLCEIRIVLSHTDELQLSLGTGEESNQQLRRPNVVDTNQVRIVSETNRLSSDGYEIYAGQFPYHALVYINNENPKPWESSIVQTAGSLITPNYILTSAEVLRKNILGNGKTYGFVELGYRNGADRERQQVIDFTNSSISIHPRFSGGLFYNIATIRLEHPATLNRYVQPIRLPRLSDNRTFEMMEGTSLGHHYNGTMRYMRNQVLPHDNCLLQEYVCTNSFIGGAFCNRVDGAGLTVEDEDGPILIGFTMRVYWCDLNERDINTRVSVYRDWIVDHSDYVFDF
ncbi:AGAP005587-PA [Anopheles gambiae str. PEST]|uniref:AGAP005587-PA n=1 Tax=Anopheles gambiae TaxID=7165 RepID=A0NEX7_ANOGA|nr:AGAP005587-PA [Anopheles gambiae str. PEST]